MRQPSRIQRNYLPAAQQSAYDLLVSAIENKMAVSARYEGKYREFCPHVIGFKNGVAQLLGYQFAGESSSGLKPEGSAENWRCMKLEKLTEVRMLQSGWHTASNHGRPQTCVDEIDAEVAY